MNKRSQSEDGDRGGNGKRVRGDAMDTRWLIKSAQVGGVIGKKGASVKQIREESGACVSVLNKKNSMEKSPEQLMLIRGTFSEIASGVEMVAQALNRSMETDANESLKMRMLVPAVQVGAIIGKGGETIKSIINDTGSALTITKDALGTSTDKGVDMTGTPSALREATVRIITELLGHPVKEGTKQVLYRPHQQMAAESPFNLAGMAGIAPEYAHAQATSPYAYPLAGAAAQGVPAGPYSAEIGYSMHAQQYGYGAAAAGQLFQAGAASSQGSMLAQQVVRKDDNGEKVEQKISIPSVCAGLLIGRGGSTIQSLCKMSGSSIIIEPATDGNSTERIVSLKGTVDAIEKAIQYIKQVIESYKG